VPPIEVLLIHQNDDMLIVHSVYSHSWTWNDFYQALSREERLTRSANGRTVYRVLDFSETRYIPAGIVRHYGKMFRRIARPRSPFDTTVLVTSNEYVYTLGRILCRFYPKAALHIRHVPTVPEAYVLIKRLSSDGVL
jgi:hypothetical protein